MIHQTSGGPYKELKGPYKLEPCATQGKQAAPQLALQKIKRGKRGRSHADWACRSFDHDNGTRRISHGCSDRMKRGGSDRMTRGGSDRKISRILGRLAVLRHAPAHSTSVPQLHGTSVPQLHGTQTGPLDYSFIFRLAPEGYTRENYDSSYYYECGAGPGDRRWCTYVGVLESPEVK
jgi:hypothetical protein